MQTTLILARRELARVLLSEFIGTGMIVVAVVGSGIAAQQLTDDRGLQLLINAFATAGALLAIISAFGAVAPARFNPLVSLLAVRSGLALRQAAFEIVAQSLGAFTGTVCAHIMFGLAALQTGDIDRSSGRLVFGEVVATIGLLLIIHLIARNAGAGQVAAGVAGYIAGAYFFTSSTSFANPAVTFGRTFTTTYAGIEPTSALRFVGAQLVGLLLAAAMLQVLLGERSTVTAEGADGRSPELLAPQ
jgi:glycerol uptake facilitator-like aquaporin